MSSLPPSLIKKETTVELSKDTKTEVFRGRGELLPLLSFQQSNVESFLWLPFPLEACLPLEVLPIPWRSVCERVKESK